MATPQGIAETEELTRLRNRVAELENQTREREDALSALQESRGLLDLFLSTSLHLHG